ncbi:class I SAM-dependent methyltransferase [Shimazuella kribbensis]|uniref:class I SAM-dependent methyltransferase n=1 Tax=Shimazuella kribbensis TaxID=139808 RepID=UPI0003FCFB51|nr:SAM-dependent methyltransferase [Shimazuella kribbensis]
MDRSSTQQVTAMLQVIRSHLQQSSTGRLPFAKIMDLALYHPQHGYYNKPAPKLGKKGDFFTNVHVSNLFGYVVADYFLKYWKEFYPSSPLQLIEIGGGDGKLMEQITKQFHHKKIEKSAVRLYSVEKSSYHRAEQQQRLKNIPYDLYFVDQLEQVPPAIFSIVYSHELLDAFAVHRLIWEQGKWWEIYVTENQNRWIEIKDRLSRVELEDYTNQLPIDFAEGQQIEVNLQAKSWLHRVSDWLESGLIWTLDYGGNNRELYSMKYLDGTMRYYQAHQHIHDPYLNLGEMDMTAHVNFEDMKKWGENKGLSTYFYGSQSSFLMEAGIYTYTDPAYRNAIKQLIMGMGENFKVLVQKK